MMESRFGRRCLRTAPERLARAAGALVLAALLVVASCGRQASTASEQYTCPMHPTYIADRAGDCPICNMRLVKREKPAAAPAGASTAPAPHPAERATASHQHAPPVPGQAPVTLDATARRLAGVQTAVAVQAPLVRRVRTVGRVTADESRQRHVHVKVGGVIDKLFINVTGQRVQAGDPAFNLYSPELLASQEEFLGARRAVSELGTAALPAAAQAAALLQAAARRRLELFDVPADFIAALERGGVPQRTVTLRAPVSGFVTAKNVVEGQQVDPGLELFTITDLSRVWIEAEFYESEARLVHRGQRAVLTLPYEAGRELDGTVEYVYPFLDAATRTLKVRFAFANPQLHLKPGMYADIGLEVESPPAVVVPAAAILDSGTRQLVFVETAAGRFEPRQVRAGLRSDGMIQVLDGLAPGERVATRANFLLDSESRLRGAFAAAGDSSPGEAP